MKADSKVKTTVNGNNVEFITHNEGTKDCVVKFRMTKAVYKMFRAFYCKEDCNQFTAFEVYAHGSGWYIAISTKDVVNGAMRIKHMIHNAFNLLSYGFHTVKEYVRSNRDFVVSQMKAAKNYSERFIIKCSSSGNKIKMKVVSRSVQANLNSSHLTIRDLAIQEELRLIEANRADANKLQMLQHHFAH